MLGIDNVKKAVHGVNEVAIEAGKIFGNGFQAKEDFETFWADFTNESSAFKSSVKAAYDARVAAVEEFKDLDWMEVLQLVFFEASELPGVLDAWKK